VKATINQIYNKNYEQPMIIYKSKLVILYKFWSLFIVSILFDSTITYISKQYSHYVYDL